MLLVAKMASIRGNEFKKDPEIGKDMSCWSRMGKKKSGPMLICIFSNACKTLSRWDLVYSWETKTEAQKSELSLGHTANKWKNWDSIWGYAFSTLPWKGYLSGWFKLTYNSRNWTHKITVMWPGENYMDNISLTPISGGPSLY